MQIYCCCWERGCGSQVKVLLFGGISLHAKQAQLSALLGDTMFLSGTAFEKLCKVQNMLLS